MINRAVRERLLASTIIAGALIAATPGFAQAVPAEAAEEAPEASTGEIVVTGSLIRNPNLTSSSPVAVIGAEEVRLRQSNTAEEILRTLPGAVPNIGSAVNNGNGGLAFVDLRGLGSFRNLVLLDGVRLTPSDLSGRVDLNNIPLALVERVDTLTGGAATTYGADAVAGVVNFITRRDFAGVEAASSYQITERGDGAYFRTDITIGANFDDGKGNAVFSVGYQNADPVFQGDRDFSYYNINGATALRTGAGSDNSVPSRMTGFAPTAQQFDPALGTFRASYNPFNFNPYNVFQTPFKRLNMFGSGRYEINDSVEVYTRGMFSKNNVSTILAPGGSFAEPVAIPLNNPYLPAAARAQYCAYQQSLASFATTDYNPNVAGIQSLSPAECAAAAAPGLTPNDPAYRQLSTNLERRTVELGPRLTTYTVQYFDYRAGAKFHLSKSIDLDIAGSYGESENNQVVTGNIRTSRVRQALLANNTSTCFDGSSGCVPLNVFGADGSITPAMGNFIAAETSVIRKVTLSQARALLSGDIGYSSPLASEPIGFALGGEYRKYNSLQQSDTLSQTPGEISGAGSAPQKIRGAFDVKEVYGELIAPLVADKPFFHSLTIEGGIRYSKYKIFAAGSPKFSTTTYKAAGTWEPVDGLKLRGNYQRAVRAPNIAELFTPVQTNLVANAFDPCSSVDAAGVRTNPAPTGNLAAVCLAQGAPAASLASIAPPNSGQSNQQSGGNVNLKPEKSDSYSFGAVIAPRDVVPGLTLSVDYYNIKVTGAVSSPTPTDALNACFGRASAPAGATFDPGAGAASSVACTSIRRNPSTGQLSGSLATTPGLPLPQSNLGRLSTDGIDATLNYRRDLGFASLNVSASGNYTMSSKFKATPTAINRECVGYYSTNCASIQPKFFTQTRVTLSFEKTMDFSLLWRRIHKVRFEPNAGTLFSGTIGATAATTQPGGADNPFNGQTVNFNRVPSINYFDLTSRFGLTENLDLTLTVQNLFDKQPPITGSNIGSSAYNSGNTFPSTYDTLGRQYRVSARMRF